MFWHIDADIISIIIILIVYSDIIRGDFVTHVSDRQFKTVAEMMILAIIIDIVSSIVMEMQVSWWVFQITMLLYYIMTPLIGYFWFRYVYSVVTNEKEMNIILKICLLVPYVLYSMILLTNPFTGAIFKIGEGNSYTWGSLFPLSYTIFCFYALCTCLIAFMKRNNVSNDQANILFWYPIVAIIAFIMQIKMVGYLFIGAASAVVLLATYLSVQNRRLFHDELTDTYNRAAFMKLINKITRNKEEGSVILVSLNEFKYLNEAFGEEVGDNLLYQVAQFIKELSPDKRVYRYGGDEFSILLMRKNDEELQTIIESIRKRFLKPWKVGEITCDLYTSVGIVSLPLTECCSDNIVGAMDFSVYEASLSGKNMVKHFDSHLCSKYTRKKQVVQAIKRGLENKKFEVYYQPIYSIKSDNFEHAEALLRFTDSELGVISPAEFIPVAEEMGYINDLTYFVLEDVCETINLFNKKEIEIMIHINLSAINFLKPGLAEEICKYANEKGIHKKYLIFEITESMLIQPSHKVRKIMEEMGKSGMMFALDDYGKGYSNITYLIDLPLSIVKLDKSIIDSSEFNPTLLESVLQMLKKIGKTIVAEGVETSKQSRLLEKIGCDYIQGYYYSKPLCKKEFYLFLQEYN